MRFDAGDLSPQRLDARLEFLDRNWIEILPRKLNQRIAGLAWEEFFQIHRRNR
jgi:hypothetical protein